MLKLNCLVPTNYYIVRTNNSYEIFDNLWSAYEKYLTINENRGLFEVSAQQETVHSFFGKEVGNWDSEVMKFFKEVWEECSKKKNVPISTKNNKNKVKSKKKKIKSNKLG